MTVLQPGWLTLEPIPPSRAASWFRLSPVASTKASPDTLEGLMERYVDGDVAAFDAIYQQLTPRVFGYLLRLTRHRERAEDLLQITFTKIHRARSSYLRGAPLLPWVLAIARRSFYDERRRARSRAEDLSRDGTLPEPRSEEGGMPLDVSDALDQALDAMPEAYREAIVLTKLSGLSMNEAGEVLGASPTAVKLRVHRGYNFLRQELERFQRKP